MTLLALLVIGSLISAPEPPPTSYAAAMERLALHGCFHVRGAPIDLLREGFAIEREEGLPVGLLVAAWCNEKRYRLTTSCGDDDKSCGIVQFQGWAKKRIRAVQMELVARSGRPVPKGDPRYDYQAASRFWARHVKSFLPKALKLCKRGSQATWRGYDTQNEMVWASAAVTAVRTKSQKGVRCAWKGRPSESAHWRIRREWHRAAQSVVRLARSEAQ